MRYVGNIDESRIIKKNNPSKQISTDSGRDLNIIKPYNDTIEEVIDNNTGDISVIQRDTVINEPQLENEIKISEDKVVNKDDSFTNNKKITIENEFPVFIYEKNTQTRKVEVKNKAIRQDNRQDTLDISKDKLEIIKFNNDKMIIETRLDIEILKLILNQSNVDFNFYQNKLEYLNKELYFLESKQDFINDLLRKK